MTAVAGGRGGEGTRSYPGSCLCRGQSGLQPVFSASDTSADMIMEVRGVRIRRESGFKLQGCDAKAPESETQLDGFLSRASRRGPGEPGTSSRALG